MEQYFTQLREMRMSLKTLMSVRFISRWILHIILILAFLILTLMTLHNLFSGENEDVMRKRLIKEV